MNASLHRISGCAALALAAAVIASPAVAGGSIKDTPEPRRCTFAANVALTTDYVFRGVSQTAEGPAVQGGFDATCGLFYAGVWASNLDFGVDGGSDVANIEMDVYAGIKTTTGRISWDLGVIYYAYPKANDPTAELDYVELKVGASTEIWKGGTLGVTVFYSPEYTGETGDVWTVETGFSQALPKVGRFSPTFSALLGYQKGDDPAYVSVFGDDSYLYWNAGVSLGFDEKWTLDLRYWDTDLADGVCTGSLFQCDERFVATLKATF
jgi:uncharacterized protein (TIGR02001 family)